MESTIFVIIIIICVALILFGVIKHRFDLVVNFGLRIVAGLLGIYLINSLLDSIGIAIVAGMNSFNALVVGLLGVPGFLLVFGVATYYFFVK